jgi:hypothetical protein
MELLLFVITVLVAYIAYRFRSVVVPFLQRCGAFPYKKIRGKQHTQVEILLPKRLVHSPLRLEYKVSHAGLVRTLEIEALAIFNSIEVDGKYVWADGLKIISSEFPCLENSPGQASLVMRQETAIQGTLNFSPEAFEFLVGQLNDGRSVTLRVFGPVVGRDGQSVVMASNSFSILTEGQISGPEYFYERFLAYIEKTDREETELLRNFASRFEIPRT